MPLKWILIALCKTRLNLVNCLTNNHIFYVNIICHEDNEQSHEGQALKCQYNDRDRDGQTLEGQYKEDRPLEPL